MKIKHSNKPRTPSSQMDHLIIIAMHSKSKIIILLQLFPHLEKNILKPFAEQCPLVLCNCGPSVQPQGELVAFYGSSLPSIWLEGRNLLCSSNQPGDKHMLHWSWARGPLQGARDTTGSRYAPTLEEGRLRAWALSRPIWLGNHTHGHPADNNFNIP